jgi:hypothetical protein
MWTFYVGGNLVIGPDSSRYLCLKGPDPRGESFSYVTGVAPDAASPYWFLIPSAPSPPPTFTNEITFNYLSNEQSIWDAGDGTVWVMTQDSYWLWRYFNDKSTNPNGIFAGLTVFGDGINNNIAPYTLLQMFPANAPYTGRRCFWIHVNGPFYNTNSSTAAIASAQTVLDGLLASEGITQVVYGSAEWDGVMPVSLYTANGTLVNQ